jgi:ABC-type transporter Mla maintaining outer membrane lipid asymmetry ATPase subunit MlaF
MSVRENLAFTLKRHAKELSSEEVENQIKEILENVGLSEAIDKMPSELSGGMRKRIGLARTLILNQKSSYTTNQQRDSILLLERDKRISIRNSKRIKPLPS